MQAALMNDQGHDVRDPAFRICMTEIRHLRSSLATVQSEHDKLLADHAALLETKAQFVKLSDEETEQLRQEHRHQLQNSETKFQEKIQQLEREHRHEKEMVEQQAQTQIRQLEEEIENMKLADDTMKMKIKDLRNDKQSLEDDLEQSNSAKEKLEHEKEQLQRELENQEAYNSTHDLFSGLDDNEENTENEDLQQQLTDVKKEKSKLQDRLDECVTELALYKQQIIQEQRKYQRQNRHRRPSSGNASSVRRTGSKVGDYMKKPKEGVTSATSNDDTGRPLSRDDGVALSPTPPPATERSSADGGSSEDEIVVRQHDDEDDEDDTETLIAKYVERIKELESEKCNVETAFQELLEKKTADLQQENKQLIKDKEALVSAKNELESQLVVFETTAEATVSAHSEMQGMVIERQELQLKKQQLEMKLTTAEETSQGLKLENEELKAVTQELRADCNQFLLDIDKLEKENQQIKLQHAADIKAEQEAVTKQFNLTVSKLQQETENLHADMQSLRNEHAEELQQQNKEFNEENKKTRQKAMEECKAQIDELQSRLKEMTVKTEQLNLEVVSLMQENQQQQQQHRSEMEEAHHTISELQHKSENLQADLYSLKAENEDKLKEQKENFDEERKTLELNMSQVLEKSLHKEEEVQRQITEEYKAQVAELQCSVEHMKVANSELELNILAIKEEKFQLSESLCEVTNARDVLEKEKQSLVDSLADVQQQAAILTRNNEALQSQVEVAFNKQHAQLVDIQKSLSSVIKEKEHKEAEVKRLHHENARLQTELQEQSENALHLQTVLGQYSAEASEQRLLQEAEMKQKLMQLEEENKVLRQRQQNLHRFTSLRPEREIEGLRLENSALTRAMTKSHEEAKALKMKCQKLTEQKQALFNLLSSISYASVH
jgi:chromosome segregation ATPase